MLRIALSSLLQSAALAPGISATASAQRHLPADSTTMDTFLQGANCFLCHSASDGLHVSHRHNACKGN